jgi:ketosteroid isomerase-like protein
MGMAARMLHARKLMLAVLALSAIAVGGCGGDDSGGGGGGGGDDESQVRDVVTSYAGAVADGDGDKACGYLSDSALAQIEKAAEGLKVDGCAGVLEKATEGASDDDIDKVKNMEVTSVKITGDRATAETEVEGEDNSPAMLVKEDGEWKIAPDESPTATAERPSAATVTTP